MGSIEQRALDIISDYLRATQDPGATASQRHMSPTPGPTSPMNWPTETKVPVDEFDDDDIFTEGAETEGESKPIDIDAFKEKMKKKMSSTTNTQPFSTGNPKTKENALDRGFPRK